MITLPLVLIARIKNLMIKKLRRVFTSLFKTHSLPATLNATQGQTRLKSNQNFAKTLRLQKTRGGRKFYQAKEEWLEDCNTDAKLKESKLKLESYLTS